METTNNFHHGYERPVLPAVRTGFAGKCPACQKGKLFSSKLSVHDNCQSCGEELFHHRADDLPAYLNVFIVGHIVVGLMVLVMRWDLLSVWPLTGLAMVLALIAALMLMRPLKGAVLGAQWALRMHGFGGDVD